MATPLSANMIVLDHFQPFQRPDPFKNILKFTTPKHETNAQCGIVFLLLLLLSCCRVVFSHQHERGLLGNPLKSCDWVDAPPRGHDPFAAAVDVSSRHIIICVAKRVRSAPLSLLFPRNVANQCAILSTDSAYRKKET